MFEDADRAPRVTTLHGRAPVGSTTPAAPTDPAIPHIPAIHATAAAPAAPAVPAAPAAPAVPAVPVLEDARDIIALRESLAGMVPAASPAALQTASTASTPAVPADRSTPDTPDTPDTPVGRTPAGRFGPTAEELAAVTCEAEAIHRIRVLEDLKAACAAAQARETAALHQHRILDEAARGIPTSRRGLGLGSEIGLARRQSPQRGSNHLRQARHLTEDLPHTLTALQTGQISEEHAATVERHTHWLPAPARRHVDAVLAERLPGLGIRELTRQVQALAHQQDPEAAAEQYDQAVTTRHVRIKPAEHGMAYLTALLPALEAAACFNALTDQAATTVASGEAGGRSPQQVLSDVFVERLTGRTPDEASPVEIQLIMTDTTLLAGSNDPAWIPGHGPLPATTARTLLTDGTVNPADPHPRREAEARVFLRRLYTCPETGQLVAMESQRREFTGKLRSMIMLRDNTCRTPYCGAPIRHVDHATPYRDGGPTSYANGSGLCERCNYTKEHPGWKHQATPDQLHVTTPTGHNYTSRPRPLTTPPHTPETTETPVPPENHEPGPQHAYGPRGPRPRDIPCTTDTHVTAPVTVRLPPRLPPPSPPTTTTRPHPDASTSPGPHITEAPRQPRVTRRPRRPWRPRQPRWSTPGPPR
ncbi:DUF222 domain-containing protein [Microbacterium sp. A93]|uniref:HNH endonuclease n=1 Tax=Microbacterium sp. A93 TaxID=3450716 RepID=UPI003F42A060